VTQRRGLGLAVVGLLALAMASVPSRVLAGPAGHGPKKPPADTPPPPPPPPPPEPDEPEPKPGDARRIIAILDVHVSEGVPAEISTQFQRDLVAAVDRKRFYLAPRMKVHEKLAMSTKWTEGCLVGPCVHEVKAQVAADILLLATLTGSGTSFGSVITLVRTDSGNVLAQRSKRCDVCTLSEALAAATDTGVQLLNAVPDQLPDEEAHAHAAIDAATAPLNVRIRDLEQHEEHGHKTVGLALLVGALAVAGAGIALYEGQSSHPDYALAMAGAGGGLALGSLVILTF
jgi:hypothetical protein